MTDSRIGALDIGTVRIGIALSNPERTVALAYGTVHIRQVDNPYLEIARIFEENSIHQVVVGWPLDLDGTEGPAIRRTKQFLVQLRRHCPDLRIVRQDERLTSCAAENALQQMETKGSQKKNVVDAMAATLILQMYLDRTH